MAAIGYALLQSLVAPALPDIQRDLHTSVTGVSWVLTAYLLSASIATPLIGRLGDMYGKERLLVVVLVLLCAGTVISAIASSLALMLATTLAMLIAGAQTGRLEKRYGSKPPLLAGAALTACAMSSWPSPAASAGRSTLPRCCSAPGSAWRSRRWPT